MTIKTTVYKETQHHEQEATESPWRFYIFKPDPEYKMRIILRNKEILKR